MNTNSIDRFIVLASTGKSPTASRGEWVCHQIATVFHKLDDDLMLLDADALEGAAELLRTAAGPFSSTTEKLAIYQLIEHAGSKRKRRRRSKP